jgi:predicted RNA-binding Zn-ribbon protein involved in translation (DUF1610 family)
VVDTIFLCPECNQESRHALDVLSKDTTFLCPDCDVLFRIVPHRILNLGFREEPYGKQEMDNTSALSSARESIVPAAKLAEKIMTEMNEVADMISHHAPKGQIEIKLL